ncbi:Serine/threonine-protein kinase Nek1 [Frankliniella fusca]|uniref:Serine/threonine-protein kinase Nek1 n=1 Tax=Frankliniella fusca TaxID=407009 RepID=A0AAE1LA07_9NEOP|nr:Serine/threonine-protein kinase Nek1 [Frankliniella fusca]
MLLWKPVFGTAGHSAPPLPPRLFCWCSTLLDVPPRASCHQDGPSLDELRERPGGETQDKTCRAGARAAVRGSSRWASWDPLAVALQHKDLQQNHKFLN